MPKDFSENAMRRAGAPSARGTAYRALGAMNDKARSQ
jgi:hypothetical protein